MTSAAIEKMISFYKGNLHDIDHSLKVYAFARTIGELEGLDSHTQEILELSAIAHDIACPLCREKYGNTNGKNQELESASLVEEFFKEFNMPEKSLERISWIVSHHHTYTNVDGPDYQILLEADYIVNSEESKYPIDSVKAAYNEIFKTDSGKRLLKSIYSI